MRFTLIARTRAKPVHAYAPQMLHRAPDRTRRAGTRPRFADKGSRSRGRRCRVLLLISRPLHQRARGMPGAQCTRSLVCAGGSKYAHQYSQRRAPETSGIPHAIVLWLIRVLPGDRAFLPRHLADSRPRNLTPASGCQDHTTSPSASAPFVIGASASTASRPANVTIACRPSLGTEESILLILPSRQVIFL
jgi:hypothetical protein